MELISEILKNPGSTDMIETLVNISTLKTMQKFDNFEHEESTKIGVYSTAISILGKTITKSIKTAENLLEKCKTEDERFIVKQILNELKY